MQGLSPQRSSGWRTASDDTPSGARTALSARRRCDRRTDKAAVCAPRPGGFTGQEAVPTEQQLKISPVLLWLFTSYARRFIRRHFHAVRLKGNFIVESERPVVVYCNHASWWDPMMLILLADKLLPGRRHYAPVEAAALERYKFFKRLGFYGVERNRRRGALEFLRTSRAILESPRSALWVTPQGRFADVRERPPAFERGLGVLASRCPGALFVPVAFEYTFWEERLPETLIWIGEPARVDSLPQKDSASLSRHLEDGLLRVQEQLAAAAVRREADVFRTILQGGRGVNSLYDAWRSMSARWRGQPFRREHGNL